MASWGAPKGRGEPQGLLGSTAPTWSHGTGPGTPLGASHGTAGVLLALPTSPLLRTEVSPGALHPWQIPLPAPTPLLQQHLPTYCEHAAVHADPGMGLPFAESFGSRELLNETNGK